MGKRVLGCGERGGGTGKRVGEIGAKRYLVYLGFISFPLLFQKQARLQ